MTARPFPPTINDGGGRKFTKKRKTEVSP